jgi:DNA-binding Lrp family transcriptional regulator
MKYALLIIEKEGGEPVQKFMQKLRKIDNVLDAYVVYGRFDIVAFIIGDNDESLKRKHFEISQLNGVKWVETCINAN